MVSKAYIGELVNDAKKVKDQIRELDEEKARLETRLKDLEEITPIVIAEAKKERGNSATEIEAYLTAIGYYQI